MALAHWNRVARESNRPTAAAFVHVVHLLRRCRARRDRLLLGERHAIGARTVSRAPWRRRGHHAARTNAEVRTGAARFAPTRRVWHHALDEFCLDGAGPALRGNAYGADSRRRARLSVLRTH